MFTHVTYDWGWEIYVDLSSLFVEQVGGWMREKFRLRTDMWIPKTKIQLKFFALCWLTLFHNDSFHEAQNKRRLWAFSCTTQQTKQLYLLFVKATLNPLYPYFVSPHSTKSFRMIVLQRSSFLHYRVGARKYGTSLDGKQEVCFVLYISTRVWVLRTPNAPFWNPLSSSSI